MTFGKEFTRAVEQKQIAQQDAERARYTVEKVNLINSWCWRQAEQERQANVIRAEGEAESADMIAKAIERAGDGLIKIRSIEASKEVNIQSMDVTKRRLLRLLLENQEWCMSLVELPGKQATGKMAQICCWMSVDWVV